jgi:hypothetical protein
MSKFTKSILSISILFNFIFIFVGSIYLYKNGGIGFIKSKFVSTQQEQFSVYHKIEKSAFDVLPKTDGSTIFLGDSLTDYVEWNELLKNNDIENRGIAGDTSYGVLDTTLGEENAT